MGANKGLIIKVADQKAKTAIKGHPKTSAYGLIRPGEEGSLRLGIRLNEIEPGGSAELHYHTDCDPYDHAFYVISGDLLVTISGKEHRVGADTLIYYRSDAIHSMTNVGRHKAKVLVLSAFAIGGTRGNAVYIDENLLSDREEKG